MTRIPTSPRAASRRSAVSSIEPSDTTMSSSSPASSPAIVRRICPTFSTMSSPPLYTGTTTVSNVGATAGRASATSGCSDKPVLLTAPILGRRAEATVLRVSTALSAKRCSICHSAAAAGRGLSGPDRLHRAPGTFSILLCSACGTGWTVPCASAAELASFYPTSYGYTLEPGVLGRLQRMIQRALFLYVLARPPLRAVARLSPGVLLDVGCGRGDLGEALVRRGWRVAGVEPSAEACALARSRGVDATVGTLETVTYADDAFDAAVMRHSLEHVPDPIADLERVRRVVRPGGLLVISVPNFACWERK